MHPLQQIGGKAGAHRNLICGCTLAARESWRLRFRRPPDPAGIQADALKSEMNWEVDTILEQSISQIAEGKARVESCLLAYPAHADELRPLLVTADTMLAVPKPVLAPEAKARIEGQLLEAAVASGLARRERKPLPRPRLGSLIALPRWRLAYSALAALVIVAVLMTTLVGAASALPGSPLYRVKLATEDVWLWVAPARDEPSLHLRFARRRLDEYQKLAERGVYDQSVLDDMVAHVDAALEGVQYLPPAVALPILDEAEEVLAEQRVVLTGMLADAPAESRPQIQRILGDATARIARVNALRWVLRPYETDATPQLALTDIPTSTAEPGEALEATFTPTYTPSPTPTNTLTAEETYEASSQTSTVPTATSISIPTETEAPPSPTPGEEKPTKETPPGQTKTPLPPGLITRTPNP
jgi:hypothetical protein